LKIGFKINCRFHQISKNSRSRSSSSESPPISDAQDIPVVRGNGNGRRGSEDQEAEQSADLEVVIGKEEIVVGDEEVAVVYGPALPTRDDIAAAAREERDTQLRVYIIFAHRWKCNVIVCEINKLYIRISPQYVHNFFPL
jgi:hypothetical protein